MNETPKGKIGRLPKAVQDQVNHQLENGEKGRRVVAWLNSLPEVQAVLAAEFAGKPIREQNLSDWRRYGYQNWLRQQEARAMTQEFASSLSQPSTPSCNPQPSTPCRVKAERRPVNSPPLVAPKRSEGGSTSVPFSDHMAGWVMARYLLAIRKLVEQNAAGEPHLRTLREFLHDVVAVRRGDHRAARLKIEQDRLERQHQKTEHHGIGTIPPIPRSAAL